MVVAVVALICGGDDDYDYDCEVTSDTVDRLVVSEDNDDNDNDSKIDIVTA